MALANGAQQPHVPAWKRLGLKLKYAKDTAEPASHLQLPSHSDPGKTQPKDTNNTASYPENEPPPKKRRTSSHPATHSDAKPLTEQPSSKKQSNHEEAPIDRGRTAISVSVETEPAVAVQGQTDVDIPENHTTSETQRRKPVKRRKSVTFTGETKQNDGNSAQSAVDPSPASEITTAAFSIPEATSPAEPKSKKVKKPKEGATARSDHESTTSKQKNASTSESKPIEPPEYVRYLEHFHQDKASWKFNKNHQTALLKNLFDLRIIPSSLTPAIVAYVSGLRGAGPLQRLCEDAKSILEAFTKKDGSFDEIQAMNTESERREVYFKAMRREVKKWEEAGMPRSQYDDEQIEDMELELERGKRAEAVLSALPLIERHMQSAPPSTQASTVQASQGANTGPDVSPQTTMTSTSQPKKSSRKRKQRTDVSSDSSSSDSDSSSSDSEADRPPQNPTKGPQSVTEALRGTPAPVIKPKPPVSRTPAYQHDNLNVAYRPQNPSQLMNASAKPTKKFFDDDLLDAAFPKKKTYNEVAPKRRKVDRDENGKGRGFAYTHGTKVDESDSEDDD